MFKAENKINLKYKIENDGKDEEEEEEERCDVRLRKKREMKSIIIPDLTQRRPHRAGISCLVITATTPFFLSIESYAIQNKKQLID